MNATNRAVNRVLLLITGSVLLIAGALVASASVWSGVADAWKDGAASAITWMSNADERTQIAGSAWSWFAIVILAVLLLIVVVAVTVIVRLGGGGTRTVVRLAPAEGQLGAVTIQQGFASDAITHALDAHEEIVASRVNARQVRGASVLHVSVTVRQNTSPLDVADTVARLVDNLATLTGRTSPTVVSIHSGIRSRLVAEQSRVH